MINYAISEVDGAAYVIDRNAGGQIISGPYKNEESAKRRIRDLKRRDKEQTEIVADMEATGMISGCSTGAVAIITPAAIASEMARDDVPQSYIGLPITGQIEPLVVKLAMSSEYGKSNAFAAGMNNLDMSKFKIARHVPRQVGCYPAISKHAYQR